MSKQNRPTELINKERLFGLDYQHPSAGDGDYGKPRVSPGGANLHATEPGESTMGRRWIRWMHRRGLKQWIIPGILSVSTIVKFAIGLGSYSGA